MALLVEDGSGVAGANSYVSLAEARAYATARGETLPATDLSLEVLLVKAMDYIESEAQGPYKGIKTYPGVDILKWPRAGVYLDNEELANNLIPQRLKNVQCQLALEFQTVDPTPTLSGQLVKREKIDVIETEYAIDYKSGQKPPVMIKVNILIKPLLRNVGSLLVTRV